VAEKSEKPTGMVFKRCRPVVTDLRQMCSFHFNIISILFAECKTTVSLISIFSFMFVTATDEPLEPVAFLFGTKLYKKYNYFFAA
jgi:hypothetical protein